MHHQDVTFLDARVICGGNPEALAWTSQLASGLTGPSVMPKGPFLGHLEGCQDIRAVAAGQDSNEHVLRLGDASQFEGKTCSKP